jgi:hypothetical protein
MPAAYPEEAKNFRLLGHDASAAWGGGSLVQVHKGHAYVGAVGGSSYNGPEGFTVHDVRDPKKPHKVGEFRAPPGIHCHKLRIVGDDLLYVNSERLAGDKGKNARAGFFIFDVSKPRRRSRSASTTCRAPGRTASASILRAASPSCRTTRRAIRAA